MVFKRKEAQQIGQAMISNISLGTDTQQQDAAARRLLRAGQL